MRHRKVELNISKGKWKPKYVMVNIMNFHQLLKYEWCKHLGFLIMMKEKCVQSFPPHLQFSLQSETDFPEIPSEFRISWNCLSLSDHTTLIWRSCIHPVISSLSFHLLLLMLNLVLKYGPIPTSNWDNHEVGRFWIFRKLCPRPL